MWYYIVLTAGSEKQKEIFEKELRLLPISEYSSGKCVLKDDAPEGVRIGSGGSTLSLIRSDNAYMNDKINLKHLLVHSGGLSQRMPHLSAYGKAFGLLPNGKTLLETKLDIYRNHLFDKLPPVSGIMITASDVLEDMQGLPSIRNSDADIIIFAHTSSLEVGTQHGVFVVDAKTKKLKKVLQKPSVEEMRKEGALREDGTILTDSCFFLTWPFCDQILNSDNLFNEQITEELCCYGDFMRGLGTEPKLDYIDDSPPKLAEYRRALANSFSKAKIQICELGKNTFFHFGTYREFLEHLLPDSALRNAFPDIFTSNVQKSKGFQIMKVPDSSFVEFSDGMRVGVGQNCVISGIEAEQMKIKISDDTVVFTMALNKGDYVSVMFKIDDDIKKKWNRLKWNGHDTGIANTSMWDAPIFRTGLTGWKKRERGFRSAKQ
ncbi:unnamed protein product [Caenorhabditis sp. 36 PRJEB53466]|nr:unnamed protein product [Caenorhabditis sp. 36 PRJEB53466]